MALATPASAHPIPFSYLDLRLQPDAVEGTLVAHIFDVAHDLALDRPESLLDAAVASRYGTAIIEMLAGRLRVAADGRALTPIWSGPEVLADRQSLQLHVRFAIDHAPGVVTISASLFPYDSNHQTFIN